MAYRIYISDRLYRDDEHRFIPAKARLADYLRPKEEPEKTGDEIVAEVIAKAGLVVKK